MKLKTGVAKGGDLPFRRENNLRILNGVLDIVLFQDCADENTTKEAQFPEVGNLRQLSTGPRSIGHTASLHELEHPARTLNSDRAEDWLDSLATFSPKATKTLRSLPLSFVRSE